MNLKRENSIFNFNDKNINSPIREEVSSNSSSKKYFFLNLKIHLNFFLIQQKIDIQLINIYL